MGKKSEGKKPSMTPDERRSKMVESFVAQLEKGVAPWAPGWKNLGLSGGAPMNATSKRRYGGGNAILLWASQLDFGYRSSMWMTFNQGVKMGATVRKGEKATWLVAPPIRVADEAKQKAGQKDATKLIWPNRAIFVFNLDQFDNVPEGMLPKPLPPADESMRHPESERILGEYLTREGIPVSHAGDRAYYSIDKDSITLPTFEQFAVAAKEGTASRYYSTFAHECGHSTGAEKRLNRPFRNAFGTVDYGLEELVAEQTAAFFCAEVGIEGQLGHAEYLGSWASKIKAEPKVLFDAATQANKAISLILGPNARANEPESEEKEDAPVTAEATADAE